MGSITATMPLDVFVKPGIVDNVHIGVSCPLIEIMFYTDIFK